MLVQQVERLDAGLQVSVLLDQIECFLIGRLDTDIDVDDACGDIFIEDALVTNDVVDPRFQQELLSQVPLDHEVEEPLPAGRVRRRVFIGEQHHVDVVLAPQMGEFFDDELG